VGFYYKLRKLDVIVLCLWPVA